MPSPRPYANRKIADRLEQSFENIFWKLRIVTILPVIMTALSSIGTFILGTRETFNSLAMMTHSETSRTDDIPKILGGFIQGIDLYLIGIALLIFSYGTYELVISSIDPARNNDQRQDSFKGVLGVASLDELKEKLVKVLVVALVVSAFKAMLSLPINDGDTLVRFCLALLLLSGSAYLVSKFTPKSPKA